MSEPTIWDIAMGGNPPEKFVPYADYARLKAEVERLGHQVNYWRVEAEVDNARWLRCLQDLEELRTSSFVTAVPSHQYERIVKAGDAMADRLMYQGYPETVPAWNAAKNGWDDAKEGKPSA